METKFKQDKGVAGLTILLSLITFLFVIGLLVMIFSMMGGELIDATYDVTTGSVSNETGSWLNATTYTVDQSTLQGFRDLVITSAINTTDNSSINVGNFTVVDDGFTNSSATVYASVWVSYTYVYDASNTGTDVMGDTTTSIATVTDWFPIFIVIGAMVVLILLTVIIITAIRGSGLMEASA
jgi:hypothetical protein